MSQSGEEDTLSELRTIGKTAASALKKKDVTTLLSLEREDRRAEDAALLHNPKDPLYCFLFDSKCIVDSKARSAYEILSAARELEIKASVIRSPVNGKLYGLLIFYDKSAISEQGLQSKKFRCSVEALRQVASWHFVMTDTGWKSATLFDYETGGLCS